MQKQENTKAQLNKGLGQKSIDRRFCVAPMLDYTDINFKPC
jgi:hypothetical protein